MYHTEISTRRDAFTLNVYDLTFSFRETGEGKLIFVSHSQSVKYWCFGMAVAPHQQWQVGNENQK